MGGAGNVDDNVLETPGGTYRGVGVRAFDPASGLWSIWWLDLRFPTKMDVPVRGTFRDGVGTFVADDMFEGRPIRMRFMWSRITTTSAHWEQAFFARWRRQLGDQLDDGIQARLRRNSRQAAAADGPSSGSLARSR